MKKLISIMMAIVMTIAITVVPVQAATYPNQGQMMMVKNKITQCKNAGYSIDYEELLYAVIERFYNTYIPADTTKGIDSTILTYEKNAVAELYQELNTNLTAYLDGTATPKTVARPNMGNLTVDGKYIYDGSNPVFSIGYGFFGHAQTDIPNFQKFGASNIQMEIGPHQTWGTESLGWNVYLGTEGINASATVVNTEAHSGSKSLHMVFSDTSGANRYVAAERTIPCKPNTTYTLGCWAKGTTSDWNAWMTFDWVAPGRVDFLSPSNWTEYKRTYTTGADQTSMAALVLIENTADLYLDDFYVYEDGSNINLLSNAGLESAVYQAVEDIKVHLNNAQNNNVAVSLLLAPHYLENIAAANGIPLTSDDQATFIRFDINNATAKQIIEAHIRGVLSNVQDYTCIDSICISNEPWFDTRWFDDYTDDFKAYAIEKHGSEANAKDAYGLYSWQNISMPETNFFGNYTINARAYDWMEFNDKIFKEWHEWMAGIVREYFPNTPIHSKVMENIITSGETKERVELARGTDYEMFGEFSGYSGIDGSNYTSDDYYELMFLYDYLQSAVGKPVYNSETHIIEDYGWDNPQCFEFSAANTTKALYKMWQGAIHGRNLSTVWAWQRHYTDGDDATDNTISIPDSDSNKAFYGGILFRPDLVAGLGKMNLDFARLSDRLVELQTNSKKVAIFYSKPSRLWTTSHITNVLSVYKELIKNGYDVGVVTEKSVSKLSEYDTLIIPAGTPNTTQAALTAVQNFATNGGKVLRGDSSVFTKNEYNQTMSPNISGIATYSVGALSTKAVTLKDTSTGAAPTDVEWQYSVTEDRILVNAVNTSASAKNIDVYYNGRKLANLTELIEAEEGLSTITLNSYEPQFIEYTLTEYLPNEIVDLSLDTENGKIKWKAVGENVASVAIYRCLPSEFVYPLAKVTGKEYVYPEEGTYIVRPVLKDGTELEGSVITIPSNISVAINGESPKLSIALTNNGAHHVRAKVLVEALVGEEVVAYGYGRTLIIPESQHKIDILLSAPKNVDSIKVTVYDDVNNVLAEAIK